MFNYTAIVKSMDDAAIHRVIVESQFDLKDRAEYEARVHHGFYSSYEQALNRLAEELVREQHPELGIVSVRAVGEK